MGSTVGHIPANSWASCITGEPLTLLCKVKPARGVQPDDESVSTAAGEPEADDVDVLSLRSNPSPEPELDIVGGSR